ncbi:MAG: RNA polymerase sigma factor [Mycobacteriales bacterium]
MDTSTFDAVFEAHYRTIHRFLSRRVGCALADDLAAETFAASYRARASFDPARGSVRSWLFGIATNLLRAHWRDEQHLLALEARLITEPERLAPDASEGLLSSLIAPRPATALGMLTGDQRDVLLLHAWAELSNEEIASALDVPAGTIRSRLSRARAELRAALGDLDMGHPDFALWSGRPNPAAKEER